MAKGPGKFEGEARYIPYYYTVYLDGGADEDDGNTLSFKVTPADKVIFPELSRRKVIKILEREDGFIIEIKS